MYVSYIERNMIRELIGCLCLSGLLLVSSCQQSKKSASTLISPSIYKAWDARYHYDSLNRKMIPKYENYQVGLAWGRDEQGRMNYAQYYDGQGKPIEDLLVIHKNKLDQQRGERWDELNRARVKNLTERLLNIQEATDEKEEQQEPVEDDGMDFLPTPFIPAGIDMEVEGDNVGEPSPFSPIPGEPVMDDGTEPSPFLPLTP